MRQSAALAALLVFAPMSVQSAEKPDLSWRQSPPVEVRKGDLVCRRGNGLWSSLFASLSSREPRFSHVGVVWEEGASPTLIHADASDWSGKGCVREGSWQDFFEGANATECAVFRLEAGGGLAERFALAARQRLGVPFDTAFDLGETNRLYCTELLAVALEEACGHNTVPRTSRGEKVYYAIDDLYARGFLKVFDSDMPVYRNREDE